MGHDAIVGTAVLERRHGEGEAGVTPVDMLYFVCERADGSRFNFHLPVRPEGQPETLHKEWECRVDGRVLHCHPSVLIRSLNFHNAYAWSVPFIEYDKSACVRPYRQLELLNPGKEAPGV